MSYPPPASHQPINPYPPTAMAGSYPPPPNQPQPYYPPPTDPNQLVYPPSSMNYNHNNIPGEYPPSDPLPNKSNSGPLMEPPNYPPVSSNEQRFQPPNGPQDLWAAIAFIIHFLAFLALTGYAVSQVNWSTLQRKDSVRTTTTTTTTTTRSNSSIEFGPAAISSVIVAAIVGVGISTAYLLLMRRFPKQLIKWTYWMCAIYFFIAGVLLLVAVRNLVLGGIFLLCGILNIVVWFFIRKRIPFSALLMQTVSDVTSKYNGPIYLGIASLFVQLIYSAIYTFSVIACSVTFSNNTNTTITTRNSPSVGALNYIIWLYLTFSVYWTSQVFGNVVHVTNSGVFAAWYFLSGSPQGMPASPTLGAFKRACTTSFGSICYGSLIVALIQTARSVLDSMRRNNDSPAVAFIICCLECLLSCIEDLIEAFNRYAYCQVAIYGKDYCRAAKDTWSMIKDRGIDAIIADSLIGNVLGFGTLFCAGVTTLVAWIVYSIGKSGSAVSSGNVDLALIIVLIVAAIFGAIMFSIISCVIDSGVACIFVCIAEDPLALQSTKPELHAKLRETYPEAAFISMYS